MYIGEIGGVDSDGDTGSGIENGGGISNVADARPPVYEPPDGASWREGQVTQQLENVSCAAGRATKLDEREVPCRSGKPYRMRVEC